MNTDRVDPEKMTAVLLVRGFDGFGVHTLLSINRNFSGLYKNFIFVAIGVVNSGSFQGCKRDRGFKGFRSDFFEEICRSYEEAWLFGGLSIQYRHGRCGECNPFM